MANISKVYFSNGRAVNSISTNRIVSSFKIIGGPRYPGTRSLVRDDDTGNWFYLDFTPQYLGQLMYSNTTGEGLNTQAIQYAARLFLAVNDPASVDPNGLKWVPVVNYYADSYLDPTTGKEWDPVATYVCDPPYLCPET